VLLATFPVDEDLAVTIDRGEMKDLPVEVNMTVARGDIRILDDNIAVVGSPDGGDFLVDVMDGDASVLFSHA